MPEPHLRASDADRTAVADVLGGHMSAGRLTVAEYDERLAGAYAARTYGELAALTADLPAPEIPAAAASRPLPDGGHAAVAPGWSHGRSHGRSHGWAACGGPWARSAGTRAAWASWAGTAAVVLAIWLVSMITSTGWVYPWPIWVIGPWGVVLASQSLGRGPGRERDRHRGRRSEGRLG